MEVRRVALVLVDISGYTRFMKLHTQSLLHAEAIITELLEAVIDNAVYPLTLSKLEGDAAFLYAALGAGDQAHTAARDILKQVDAFFSAFRARERELIDCDRCACDACRNIGQLKLKAFLHTGEVVFKKIRQFEELAGEDVILIHRLLKNSVPGHEYILLTRAFEQLSGGFEGRKGETRTEQAEGIGEVAVSVYYPQESSTPLPAPIPPGPPTPGTKYGVLANRLNGYAVKRMTGKLAPTFTHLPQRRVSLLSAWGYFVVGVVGNIITSIRYRMEHNA